MSSPAYPGHQAWTPTSTWILALCPAASQGFLEQNIGYFSSLLLSALFTFRIKFSLRGMPCRIWHRLAPVSHLFHSSLPFCPFLSSDTALSLFLRYTKHEGLCTCLCLFFLGSLQMLPSQRSLFCPTCHDNSLLYHPALCCFTMVFIVYSLLRCLVYHSQNVSSILGGPNKTLFYSLLYFWNAQWYLQHRGVKYLLNDRIFQFTWQRVNHHAHSLSNAHYLNITPHVLGLYHLKTLPVGFRWICDYRCV